MQNCLEIDLIIEKNMQIFPFEIKLSKTPNINMAKPIERFKKIFHKLNIFPGKIICLREEDGYSTSETSIESLDSYLRWLKKTNTQRKYMK